MQVTKRVYAFSTSLLISATLLAACSSAPSTSQPTAAPAAATSEATAATAAPAEGAATAEATTGSEEPLVVLQGVDATTLDPQYTGSIPEANILNHIFDRLVDQDREGNLIPMLATEWSMMADDQTVWEFKLNPDAVWADGEPLTADDVIFTWERSTNPDNKIVGNTAYLLNNMKIVSIEAPDEHTVQIKTEQPSVTLPGSLSQYYILPRHYYEGLSTEDASLKPLGSGPYQMQEWVKDDHLTMVLNPNYWGTPASIPEVIWRPVPEAATRLAELLSGGADLIDNLQPNQLSDVEGAGLRTTNIATGRRIYIGMNQAESANQALKDKLVRQALNYAVDFDAISTALLNGAGKRSGSTINPPWQNPEVTPYTYDVEQAKALLAEAGWTDSDGNGFVDKDGEELTLVFDSPNGRYIQDLQIAQAVGQYLIDAGVNVEVQPQEWSNYVSRLNAKELDDLYLLGSGSNFEGQADAADLDVNSSSNYAQWSNEQYNAWFTELQGTIDPAERQNLLNQMQVLVKDEAPYIFLYMQVAFFGTSERMGNWQPYPNERIHLENVTLQ